MNKQELIERIEGLKNIFGNKCEYVKIDFVIELASELDEPKAGHADEAPRYVKNILARLRKLPLHDREVWLKAIMGEFERDFSRAKWCEGYEQGKVEGFIEREKVTVPQFVADWIERSKQEKRNLRNALNNGGEKMRLWFLDQENYDLFARAWLDGYEVEKEKRYYVRLKGVVDNLRLLRHNSPTNTWTIGSEEQCFNVSRAHTRKELEEAGFGWVFDCPGIEIREVEE